MEWSTVLPLMLKAWGLVALLMFLLWLVQAKYKNASYVDIGWTIGIGICAGVYVFQPEGVMLRKAILIVIVLLWCIRLTRLLMMRLIKDPSEDSRYRRIRDDWKTHQNFKFFLMFQFQGLLDVVLAWPFLLICFNENAQISHIEWGGIILSILGLVGEAIADRQLRRFKDNIDNKGKTCDVGLWYYSRHPNYFFEWVIWVGYFVFACGAPLGLTAILAPCLMYIFLMKVSGVPLAEAQALKTKGDSYRQYQATTSMFVPWFKKQK